jgi:LmbE family N-acetylglucosaminyl deacetylase
VIVPLVEEEVWQEVLADLPPFNITAGRILLVSPHPDDETLGAGAFLASQRKRGTEVEVVAVTDGENAYADNAHLAATRRQEQDSALVTLDIQPSAIHRFGFTDSGVEARKEGLVDLLLPLITPVTQILAPWIGDYHPDHKACGWAAREAATLTGAPLSYYFFWTWHRGTPADLIGLDLYSFPLSDSLLALKLKALACHHSQLHRTAGDAILPDELLAPAKRKFEVFALA